MDFEQMANTEIAGQLQRLANEHEALKSIVIERLKTLEELDARMKEKEAKFKEACDVLIERGVPDLIPKGNGG